MAEIEGAVEALGMPGLRLWAEPGRALVAAGMSLVVQVQGRRDRMLFINDGIYGSLSDAGLPGFRYPTRLLRESAAPIEEVGFFGPTCDSADRMAGPFLLPADAREGDWIEVGQLGAYGACLRTLFNGFDRGVDGGGSGVRKVFFFEKKKQKTFVCLGRASGLRRGRFLA